MDFNEQTTLGSSGLKVGRLGIASSFGAPTEAYEEAFERGCNYFTWGTFIKGRSTPMLRAIHNIEASGRREQLVVAMYAYSHSSFLIEKFFKSGLKSLGLDYLDVLILGYYSKRPSQRHIDRVHALVEKGLVRTIGLSGHNRKLFPKLVEKEAVEKEAVEKETVEKETSEKETSQLPSVDVFHLRYNAAHRGAETEIFDQVDKSTWPGIVSFTATRWGKLLKQRKMPQGVEAPSAADCYRFALSHPAVDVCMVGSKDTEQMRQNLTALDLGPLDEDEMDRMRKIGDHVYGRKTGS